ncbi:hypothetical protein JAAARDRAFT_180698 [Jaapia argillacea MUCL 33604]|uniref:DUF4419 domain-containing protein n=1 Tax=Jaapia argillacea MUCL 33604 TaxID=933084 RepID=A0A067PLQ4_9AGAM|nr:hypothetical protein JAAARDRAFT_180698 [Jaapia argillacea MUCL 33604]
MPVTFTVASHLANPVRQQYRPNTVDLFLSQACDGPWQECEELLRSTIGKDDIGSLLPHQNGFLDTVVAAYSQHHHLSIRPDNVWIAILTQLSFYINANAEELRSQFVAHEGKKELVVRAVGTRYTFDWGKFALVMTEKLDENLVDKDLKEWIMPTFTTTTVIDTTIFAIQMMSTLKSYFDFKAHLMCGIPSVTLQGEKSDWENLLSRIPKLATFGEEAAHWADLLTPILTRFVEAFDGKPDVEFWSRIADSHHNGSGPSYFSGWITAFNVWDQDGKWVDKTCLLRADISSNPHPPKSILPAAGSKKKGANGFDDWTFHTQESIRQTSLILDGRPYPIIDSTESAPGFCTVDVKLDDNGELLNTTMVAGHFACRVEGDKGDTLKPEPGWFMFVKGEKKQRNPWAHQLLEATPVVIENVEVPAKKGKCF